MPEETRKTPQSESEPKACPEAAADSAPFDEAEDEYSRSKWRLEYIADQVRCAGREMVDGVLKFLPPDVTEHLNNSRKELLLAARTMIDAELSAIDRCTRRARDLHETDKQQNAES